MTTKAPYLLLTVVFLLACGAPAYIAPSDTSAPIYQSTAKPAQIVTTAPLTVRESPCLPSSNLEAGKVEYLEAGEAVVLLGAWVYCKDGGAWVLIEGGWINARYLEIK